GLPQAKEGLQKVAQQPVAPKRQESVKLQPTSVPTRGTAPGEKKEPIHPPHVPSPFEITRYDLAVRLDPARHTLAGTATLGVRSRNERLASLLFALSEDFTVDRASQDRHPLVQRRVNDRLTLEAAEPVTADRESTLRIEYHRSSAGPRLRSGDVIWPEGSFLRSETRWYP